MNQQIHPTAVAGACRFCRCTETTPCEGGCAWSDESQTLCTACECVLVVAELFASLPYRLRRETPPPFAAQPVDIQTLQVMTLRHAFDDVRQDTMANIGDEEIIAQRELVRLAVALQERYPQRVRELLESQSSIVDVVLALLGEHATTDRRGVLAG